MTLLERILTDPARLAKLKRWFYVCLGVIAAAEIVLPLMLAGGHGEHGGAHFSFENFPAWGSIYGFISCVVIIIVSKLIGKIFLMRREDYYER